MIKIHDVVDYGFAQIKYLDLTKVELIFQDKIEVTGSMIDLVFSSIEANTVTGRGLLINKLHDYCYSFDAQVKLADTTIFSYIAVVRADGMSNSPTGLAIDGLSKPSQKKEVKVFALRDEALDWLTLKLGMTFY